MVRGLDPRYEKASGPIRKGGGGGGGGGGVCCTLQAQYLIT